MREKIGIIADDLTGAMEVGAQLKREGFESIVYLNIPQEEEIFKDDEIIIIDTESRNVSPEVAYNKVKEVLKSFYINKIKLFYKKIDSTLRGNIGKELEAIIEEEKGKIIIIVPAVPSANRVTINGYQYVNGKLISETEFAKDPLSPVKSSYIPEIISYQTSYEVELIILEDVINRTLDRKIKEAWYKGISMVVVDAVSEQDLSSIIESVKRREIRKRLLFCGSAGIVKYLSKIITKNETNTKNEKRIVTAKEDNKPVLVVCGSPSEISWKQMKFAQEHGEKIELINVRVEKLFSSLNDGEEEIRKVKGEIIHAIERGNDVIVWMAEIGREKIFFQHNGNIQMIREKSNFLQEKTSELIECVLKEIRVSGLILVGGDTAWNVLSKLGIKRIKIIDLIYYYLPVGVAVGEKLGDILCITKAGGAGEEDSILKAIQYFRKEDGKV